MNRATLADRRLRSAATNDRLGPPSLDTDEGDQRHADPADVSVRHRLGRASRDALAAFAAHHREQRLNGASLGTDAATCPLATSRSAHAVTVLPPADSSRQLSSPSMERQRDHAVLRGVDHALAEAHHDERRDQDRRLERDRRVLERLAQTMTAEPETPLS